MELEQLRLAWEAARDETDRVRENGVLPQLERAVKIEHEAWATYLDALKLHLQERQERSSDATPA
jgi:hypothetical protein